MAITLLPDLNVAPPEELDSGIILGGMAAADDEADTLAQNEGDAQEAAGTTCAFAYLFFLHSSEYVNVRCTIHNHFSKLSAPTNQTCLMLLIRVCSNKTMMQKLVLIC